MSFFARLDLEKKIYILSHLHKKIIEITANLIKKNKNAEGHELCKLF